MDADDMKSPLPPKSFDSPPPGYSKLNCSDEVARLLLEEDSELSLQVHRPSVPKCRGMQDRLLAYEDMTPPSRVRRRRSTVLTVAVHCQTIYSFPVDFDLGIFFGMPLFLHLNDEVDSAILDATRASGDEVQLRLQLYSESNDESMIMSNSEHAEDSTLSHESATTPPPDDEPLRASGSFIQETINSVCLSFNDVSPDGSFVIDGETDCEKVRRSSWNSEDFPMSPSISPIQGIPASSFNGHPTRYMDDSDYQELEEHLSRAGVSPSPIHAVQEASAFHLNGGGEDEMEEGGWNDLDCQYYSVSTCNRNQQPSIEGEALILRGSPWQGEMPEDFNSSTDVPAPEEVMEVSMKSVSLLESSGAAFDGTN